MDVETEVVRITDYNVRFGVSSDEGEGDEWPRILEKVLGGRHHLHRHADLVRRARVGRAAGDRAPRRHLQRAPTRHGQYPLYNKVGCVVVTGNEDGAHAAAETTLFNLTHLGCAIPPNADTYWVGDAGPGPSYIEAGGADHDYTKRTTRWMAHNTVHLARILKAHADPAEGNTFDDETKHRPTHGG